MLFGYAVISPFPGMLFAFLSERYSVSDSLIDYGTMFREAKVLFVIGVIIGLPFVIGGYIGGKLGERVDEDD